MSGGNSARGLAAGYARGRSEMRRQNAIAALLKPGEMIVRWNRIEDGLPDADTDVLIHTPESPSEPVWPAFWDGEIWRYASADPCTYRVTHWTDMLTPPMAYVLPHS